MVLGDPEVLKQLIEALRMRGYREDGQFDPLVENERSLARLTPPPPEEIGAVWCVHLEPEGWLLALDLGSGTVHPAAHVKAVMDGLTPHAMVSLPPLDEQARTVIAVVDRLRVDQVAKQRAVAALGPKPEDSRLGPRGNDPCWCGSGKKLKRCHPPLPKS